MFFYPPEDTWIIVSSWLSLRLSSIGIGLSLFITISVSGLRLIFLSRSSIVDPFSRFTSFILFILDNLTFIFTWIDIHIKNALIKLLTSLSVAGVAKPGLRRRSRKPLVFTLQGFKSLPQRTQQEKNRPKCKLDPNPFLPVKVYSNLLLSDGCEI